MADNRIEFHYTAQDVASAQRLRFARSKQLKLMVGLWVASTLFLLVSMQFLPPSAFLNRETILTIALVYVVGMAVLILIAPYLDFTFNRFWRLPLQLQFNEKTLKVSVVKGKSKGLTLTWDQIQRVQENQRVIILHYGEGKKFVILPKSAFESGQDGAPSAVERRFRDILRRRGPQIEGAPQNEGAQAARTAQKQAQPDPVLEEEETAE